MTTRKYKVKTGRPETKYTFKTLSKLINISDVSLFNLNKDNPSLGNILITGIIIFNEKDNSEFWDDMNSLKEEVGTPTVYEGSLELPSTKKWRSVDSSLLDEGKRFFETYGLSSNVLINYFYGKAYEAHAIAVAKEHLKEKTGLPSGIFFK